MPKFRDCILRVGSNPIADAYFRGESLCFSEDILRVLGGIKHIDGHYIAPWVAGGRASRGMVLDSPGGEWVMQSNQNPDGTYGLRRSYDALGNPCILLWGQTTNLYPYGRTNAPASVSVTAQSYTVSMVGSGAVAISGAYTGILSGTGGNNRVTLTFTPSAGTLVITPSGSPRFVQLEPGLVASPPVPTDGASATCAADVATLLISDTGLTDAMGAVLTRFKASPTDGPSREVFSGGIGRDPMAVQYGGAVSSWDGVTAAQSSSVDYTSSTHTAVSSWGIGKSVLASAGEEISTAYSGAITSPTMFIGNNSGLINPLNGEMTKLYTFPSQLTAPQRSQLVGLWG